MLFKDAIQDANPIKVKEYLLKDFNDVEQYMDKYMEVLNTLKNMESVDTGDDITITVDWNEPEEDLDFGDKGYWRVHGYQPNEPMFWGIEYSAWQAWLGWKADERFILMYDIHKYVALCLWEMTWAGFTEKDVEAKVDLILKKDDMDL